MTGRHTRSLYRRKGSFALEAALTIPILLVILLFLVSMIVSVPAELRLKTAADRTAAEMALLPPVIFSLIDEGDMKLPIADLLSGSLGGGKDKPETVDGLAGQLRAGLLDIIKPDKLEALINDAALDLGSSVLFADLVNARIRYWYDRLGPSRLLGPPSAWLDWNLADDQLFLEIDYEVRTLLGRTDRRCTALVPIWRPHDAVKEKAGDEESIWHLDNFTRGRKLRDKFGGNLPSNYPVIARFEDGEALAIKSMDLTKPTYADPKAVIARVSEQLEALAAFNGTPKPFGRDSVWIRADQIASRRLLLIVPVDSDLGRYAAAFAMLSRDAASRGIVLDIITYGKALPASTEAKPEASRKQS